MVVPFGAQKEAKVIGIPNACYLRSLRAVVYEVGLTVIQVSVIEWDDVGFLMLK